LRGHIRKRDNGSWAVIIDVGRDADGKRRQRWRTVRGTRKDAEKKLAELLHQVNTGEFIDTQKMTVGQYLAYWLKNSAKDKVSGRTFQRYEQIVTDHLVPAFGGTLLRNLQPLHIQSYYRDALDRGRKDGNGGLSPTTVLQHHRVLRRALGQAVRWQMLARNVADAVDAPRAAKTDIRVLDEDELARLLELITETRIYMPTLLAATTGMRRGEILALKWSDVDLRRLTITVFRSLEQTSNGVRSKPPKSAKGRRLIALPQWVADSLRKHKAKQAEARL